MALLRVRNALHEYEKPSCECQFDPNWMKPALDVEFREKSGPVKLIQQFIENGNRILVENLLLVEIPVVNTKSP